MREKKQSMKTQSAKLYQDRKTNKLCGNRCLEKARNSDTQNQYNIEYNSDWFILLCMWNVDIKSESATVICYPEAGLRMKPELREMRQQSKSEQRSQVLPFMGATEWCLS